MNRISILLLLLHCSTLSAIGMEEKTNIYLIPGMGTDHRVFHNFDFSDSELNPIPIIWKDYKGCKGLKEYARILATQIDTSMPFILVGVSMGGMLAMEISEFLSPEAIILISSAKSEKEIPWRYKLGKIFPVYKLIGNRILSRIAKRKRTFRDVNSASDKLLYEDMLKETGPSFKLLYEDMLKETGPSFLKWQIQAIVKWKFKAMQHKYPIYHIHGDKDNILPIRKINSDKIVEKGTHKMVVNHSRLLSEEIIAFFNR